MTSPPGTPSPTDNEILAIITRRMTSYTTAHLLFWRNIAKEKSKDNPEGINCRTHDANWLLTSPNPADKANFPHIKEILWMKY